MSIDELVKEIDALNTDEKRLIIRKIQEMLVRRRKTPADINKYRGIAKNLWNQDAQEYINQLRHDDRI